MSATETAGPDREQVLTALRRRIVAFAASRLPRDVAEDLAQEVLVLLTRKYPHLSAPEDLVPLSLRIVRFKMSSHWRKNRRRGEVQVESLEELHPEDTRPDPERVTQHRLSVERMRTAFAKLEGRCRELFQLKLAGLSFPDIQKQMGAASINTVYTWDSRCRKRLLDLMGGTWEAGEVR